jgi:hypothetical protein
MTDLLRRRELPLGVAAGALALAYGLAPTGDGQVTCLLRVHTGQACPVCGMSRAVGNLVHGDFGGAFAYHPAVYLLSLQLVGFAVWRYWWGNRPMEEHQVLRLVWSVSANVGLLLLVWGLRIATGHLDHVY